MIVVPLAPLLAAAAKDAEPPRAEEALTQRIGRLTEERIGLTLVNFRHRILQKPDGEEVALTDGQCQVLAALVLAGGKACPDQVLFEVRGRRLPAKNGNDSLRQFVRGLKGRTGLAIPRQRGFGYYLRALRASP